MAIKNEIDKGNTSLFLSKDSEWLDKADDLKNYKAKAEYYIREHQDNEAIKKLKSNIPLSHDDIA